MKIIKSLLVFVSVGLLSLPCFAGTRFYCPDPSSMHAQGTSESYKYIGTNGIGIVFESTERMTGDVKKAPTLTEFHDAAWNEWSDKSHDGSCFYKNALGYGVAVEAKFHGSFKPVGNAWLWFPKDEDEESQAVCSSSNSYDCAFEFSS